jgi:hypothetical protein
MLHLLALISLLAFGYLTLGVNSLGSPSTLETGVPTQLWSGTAAGVGTYYFVVQPGGAGAARTLNLEAIGTGAVPTTVTANVEQTNDGGATWQAVGTAGTGIALVATGTGTAFNLTNLVAGPVYRLNVTTLTLGSATAAVIVGTLS